jgi:SPP1 family predicted phage head-tail adaptor
MTPSIGQMRMLLQFAKPDKDSDTTGGQFEAYPEWFTCRGYIEFERGFRDFETGRDESIKTFNCWIPWRSEFEVNVSKDTRVMYESREFAIESWRLLKEQRRMYQLQLTEVR